MSCLLNQCTQRTSPWKSVLSTYLWCVFLKDEEDDSALPYRNSDPMIGTRTEKIPLKASDSMDSLYSGRSSSSKPQKKGPDPRWDIWVKSIKNNDLLLWGLFIKLAAKFQLLNRNSENVVCVESIKLLLITMIHNILYRIMYYFETFHTLIVRALGIWLHPKSFCVIKSASLK